MKSDDTSLFDDPTTPGYVRDLLQAGRRANAEYDVERGLAKHLAALSSAPAGHWAPTTAAKVSTHAWPSWIGFAAMPLAAASVAGLLWVFASDRPAPTVRVTDSSAVAASSAEAARAPSENAAPAAARPHDGHDAHDAREDREDNEARPERRRSGVRSNAVRSRAAANARATDEGDFEGVAIGSGEAPAIDTRSSDGVSKRSALESRVASAESRPVQNQAQPSATSSERGAVEPARAAPEAESARTDSETAAKPAPVVDESRLEREMQMLAVTQRVLATDPARALRLSEQGEREFRGSMFSAERRQLGLLALVKLGRLDEARRAGRPFLARYPKAPWSERLRRALATGIVE